MEPTGITLDDATLKLLTAANGHPLPLRNADGLIVGYYVSPAQMANLTPKEPDPWTPEEIARLEEARKNDPRPDIPHEEVLRWFKEQ
ncbi:MAG: hypothetical protein K8U57_00975 [Planctomycetes bacterium]|nr:hypothetical protein [Planctomycetota bacterium]